MTPESGVVRAADERTIPLLVEPDGRGRFALFPDESGGGVAIGQEETFQLSAAYSDLYRTYVSRLSARLAEHFDIAPPAADVLARRALVPLTHCFLDRLVRVSKAIQGAPGPLAAPRREPFPTPDTIETLEAWTVENPAFNQAVVSFIGQVWSLPESDLVPDLSPFAPQVGFRNNLFLLYGRTPSRMIKKLGLRVLAALPRSRFPTLTMANAKGALSDHGFYAVHLKDIGPRWPLAIRDVDRQLRDALFPTEFTDSDDLDRVMAGIALEPVEQQRTAALLSEFLRMYYPPSLLESIPENLERASATLKTFKRKVLISSSGRGSAATFVVAAAKQEGFKVVDAQHGGQYGYLRDLSVVLELEYPGVDQFVSWGWHRLPECLVADSMSVVDLPSPWLSERRYYWARMDKGRAKDFDVLLMPNMVKRFTPAAFGGSTSRRDLVEAFAHSLREVVRAVTDSGFRLLHKPYNVTTVQLLAETMRELDEIGPPRYVLVGQLDKGLTHELVQRCYVVLWDQPGTGFLECLVSNIPTLVYWPRTYSEEERWVESMFADLEKVGIVHRNVGTLVEEIGRLKRSPDAWMADPERVSVVECFCREFAWTSDDWPKQWRQYLHGLT